MIKSRILKYIKYPSHFVPFLVGLEVGLQSLHFNFIREFFFEQLGPSLILNILWSSGDILLFFLLIAGFFKYLKKGGAAGMSGYIRWLVCSFVLTFLFNLRVFYFFCAEDSLILHAGNLDFDYGVFLARVILIIFALFFLFLLYLDVFSKSLFILELPFIVGLLLWFFLLAVRSFNFIFIFILMESITLLVVIIISIYFIFFGARLLKPIIHFFVFNLIISTFFLLGLGILFFFIPVSGIENLTYFMVLINFWVFSLSGLLDPLLLLVVFKFSMACFFLPFVFKLTIAPFSFWVVHIYSKLPIVFLFILMGVYKFIYILLFLKIFLYVLDLVSVLQGSIVLSLVCCLVPSMFVGCLAYRTTDLKTILAITTVSQMGYILAGFVTHDIMAIKYALIYLLIYILNLLGIFIIFVKLQKEFFLVSLNQLFLVKYYSKNWFYVLFILFASLAGFPPFSGFFLKYFLFLHIYKSGFFVLAVAGILSGYIMSIIYLQLLIELSILKTIPWATYQFSILNGITFRFGQKYRAGQVGGKNYTWFLYSKKIYRLLGFVLLSLAFMNVFFLALLPLFSHYLGLFAFFFVYGLYLNSDLPAVREELVWFENGFVDVPLSVFDETTDLERIAFFIDNVAMSTTLGELNKNFPELQDKFLRSFGPELVSLTLCLEKGASSSPFVLKYIDAWCAPAQTIEEYLTPLVAIENFVITQMENNQLDMITTLTTQNFPLQVFICNAGVNTFASYSDHRMSADQIAAYEIVHKSALEVYSPELFGYSLYDALTLRFRKTPFPPAVFWRMDHNEWASGLKGAPAPDFDKLFWRSPLWFDNEEVAKLIDEILVSDNHSAKAFAQQAISVAQATPVEDQWR